MDDIGLDLQRAIEILSSATKQNAAERKTAVRWFNRLYYDLVRWNEDFIQLLRAFPGFAEKVTKKELNDYRQRFEEYESSLEPGHPFGGAESDICGRVDFLAARLPKDFEWLKQRDPRAFHELEYAVGRVRDLPGGFRGASSRIYRTVEQLHYELFGSWQQKTPPIEKARRAIEKYIKDSDKVLGDIWAEARKVGLLLLSVSEYDDALHRDGSANPQLYVIGEMTMARDTINVDNRGGVFSFKATLTNVSQSISTAPAVKKSDRQELQELITQLQVALEPVIQRSPADAERIVAQVEGAARELSRPKPDGGFLKITAQGLEHAARAVQNIAPPILDVTSRIVEFLGKYF